ncbi:hypothetical protein QUW13_11755 [Enterococcus hirae]|nr:hypothetical protein [Enterococcus hirae]
MERKLNRNIVIDRTRKLHSKASEEYVSVKFIYPNSTWEGWVPVVYRRTGLDLHTIEEVNQYLDDVYIQMNPSNYDLWLKEQITYWDTEKPKAKVTRPFFDILAEGGWKCRQCQLPSNPNFARRIQDLKEDGYTIATDTNRYCNTCQKNTTQLLLLPIKRGGMKGNGYETWSPTLRKRILKVLGNRDAFEAKVSQHLLPDHKFSEIRWDENTKVENPNDMSDDEIRAKFQLLSNQRNQQKREVCRECFQTGKRGSIFGINFFYHGNKDWDSSIPIKGRAAEQGCIGCPWYDIDRWRLEAQEQLLKE